jgi:LysR family hydrogen peroxide-inducible transcriptional activator
MRLFQLNYLIMLHEHQHFGRAATACFISQSTLSTAIANLEDTLATQLLERDHKTFLFTPMGEEIVRRGKSILEQSNDLLDYAGNQDKIMQGKFYLGVIPSIAPFILSELQTLCQQLYPKLNLFIREDTTDNVLNYLREGKLDLVILALPYATEGLQIKILCQDFFKLVLPKTWLHQGFDKDMSYLPENSIFLLEKEHCLTGHALQACQLRESKKINHFFATSLHTLIQMVSHQPGITFLTNLAINSGILKGTDLVSTPLKTSNAFREIGVAWRITSQKTQNYLRLTELIQKITQKKCAENILAK